MEQNKQRIVVKVGTSTLTHNSGALDLWSMEHLVRTLADLQGMGHEVILVSSGAIAVGTAKLGLSERPKELRMKQAAAAVGQCRMMHRSTDRARGSLCQIFCQNPRLRIQKQPFHLLICFPHIISDFQTFSIRLLLLLPLSLRCRPVSQQL